jgi:hypothetical protein
MRRHHISSYLPNINGAATRADMKAHDSTKDAGSEAVTSGSPGPPHFEIRVTGHLDARWAAWFDGLTLTNDSDGTTIIHGPVADQAALHGVLQKLRDVALPLVSVTQLRADQ